MGDFIEMRNVPGYEDRYATTKDGRIWSYKRKKFLMPCTDKDGYLKIVLYDGSRKTVSVHRVILMTWNPIENMENYDCAHLDDDKDNNNLNNLMWMTRFENNHWNDKIERGASKRRIPVFQYDLDGNYITSFEGLRRAENTTGFDRSEISNCAKGKRKEYKGFIWSFIGPDNK